MVMQPAKGGGKGKKATPGYAEMVVPASFTMSCSGGGIVDSVLTLAPDLNGVEWNALSALYDEYKVMGCEVKYNLAYSTPIIIPSTSVAQNDYNHVLVYDPVDITALTSVRSGVEAYKHFRFTAPTWLSVGTVAAPGIMGVFHGFRSLKFGEGDKALQWNLAGTTSVVPPGQWMAMAAASANPPFGFLKSYGTSWHAAVKPCITGVIFMKIALRTRK
jgi:hypothetical protein